MLAEVEDKMDKGEETQRPLEEETHLDFALLPDVPFRRVLNYLPGTEIEKCREISRLFCKRIDMNRKWLPPVYVAFLSIDQKSRKAKKRKQSDALSADNHNWLEPIIFITIFCKYGAASLAKTLESFDYILPRMSIETLHLELEYFDNSTFHQFLKKFKQFNTKCQNLFVVTSEEKFQWHDLRPMLLQLEPKCLSLLISGKSTPLGSAFWQEKFIRDLPELRIMASRILSFNDQVLLNLTASTAIICGDNACTLEGIISFLKEWKAGTREVEIVRITVQPTDLDINAVVAMLPWKIEPGFPIKYEPSVGVSSYSTDVVNSLGKEINLSISQYPKKKEIWFSMESSEEECDSILYLYDDNARYDRLRLRYEPARKFDDEELLRNLRSAKSKPLKEVPS